MAKAQLKEEDLEQTLKPFYDRAAEAEDRLAKLEELLIKKGNSANETKESSIIEEFQSKLTIANADIGSEREKASKEIEKLTAENQKLKYRVAHLIRALRDADSKLAASVGSS
ncbi:Serine/threonine-protein kinase TAO1-A [Rhynchospora pubera]|uniref:Serine/threonine-protein kinase TAO1-A n=1 Tax=Rhynchospora pubera TaxID=906938 RepID=A0AAV8HC82_9POAL|nr:Serine/threonine-protein kinase TAO1-A [Rhynchospora pubera]